MTIQPQNVLLILSILEKGDYYPYDITKSIKLFSYDMLTISQNTIYTAIYKLEEEGLISDYTKLVGKKGTRIYYHLEPAGKEYLEKISANYQTVAKGVETIFKTLSEMPDVTDEHNQKPL